MEKRKPHYNLKQILAQMDSVKAMNLTLSAVDGIRMAGMLKTDALEVVQGLTNTNFYKSITTYANNKIWQDVYYTEWQGKQLYVKFQQAGKYFIVSFKEQENGY